MRKALNIRMGENPITLRPCTSITEISAKASVNPRTDDKTHATITLPRERSKNRTTRNAVKLGSSTVKSVLSAKLVFDIEKTAIDRSGMTANSPTMTAKSGKTNPGTASARTEDRMKTKTQMVIVKSEKAMHLLK